MSTPAGSAEIGDRTLISHASEESALTVDTVSAPRAGDSPIGGLLGNQDLRRFVKFCIVGLSSTIITFIVLNLCYHFLRFPLFTSLTAAFLLSVLNGFFWNRRWTWKDARANAAHDQGLKFLAVNIVGYILNTTIVVLIVAHFSTTGGLFGDQAELKAVLYNILSGEGKHVYPKLLVNGAQAAAVGIVVWWNFFANRYWTFRH